MDLADHQRKLLALFRSTYQVRADDNSYIRMVAQSKDLKEARRNVFLWRVYVLERTCALTFTLLKRRKLLKKTLNAFITRHNISPFRETQAPAFLESLSDHHDSLIASVAQFELALMKVREGDPGSYLIHWNVDPTPILNSLAKDIPLSDKVPEGAYQVLISRDLPLLFQITPVQREEQTISTIDHSFETGKIQRGIYPISGSLGGHSSRVSSPKSRLNNGPPGARAKMAWRLDASSDASSTRLHSAPENQWAAADPSTRRPCSSGMHPDYSQSPLGS